VERPCSHPQAARILELRTCSILAEYRDERRLTSPEEAMICVAVTYVVKSGHESEAAELFRKLTEQTRREPGCRMYLAHRSTSDPRRFFLYEQYDDQAALDAHRAAPHFETYVKNGLFLIIESRTPELLEPLTA
jgi:quinol monooxygenase YgiN